MVRHVATVSFHCVFMVLFVFIGNLLVAVKKLFSSPFNLIAQSIPRSLTANHTVRAVCSLVCWLWRYSLSILMAFCQHTWFLRPANMVTSLQTSHTAGRKHLSIAVSSKACATGQLELQLTVFIIHSLINWLMLCSEKSEKHLSRFLKTHADIFKFLNLSEKQSKTPKIFI